MVQWYTHDDIIIILKTVQASSCWKKYVCTVQLAASLMEPISQKMRRCKFCFRVFLHFRSIKADGNLFRVIFLFNSSTYVPSLIIHSTSLYLILQRGVLPPNDSDYQVQGFSFFFSFQRFIFKTRKTEQLKQADQPSQAALSLTINQVQKV